MPKEGIHPNYKQIRVQCACGTGFETRSTHKGDIHVEICSACHPFFTGKQKLVDTAGRVERFRRKYAKSDSRQVRGSQSVRGQVKRGWSSQKASGNGGLCCVGAR